MTAFNLLQICYAQRRSLLCLEKNLGAMVKAISAAAMRLLCRKLKKRCIGWRNLSGSIDDKSSLLSFLIFLKLFRKFYKNYYIFSNWLPHFSILLPFTKIFVDSFSAFLRLVVKKVFQMQCKEKKRLCFFEANPTGYNTNHDVQYIICSVQHQHLDEESKIEKS